MDWNPEIYEHYALMLKLGDNILSFDELDLTIEEDTTIGKDILFSF